LDKKQLTGNIMLLLTATIWGSAFVAQRVGMDYVGPLTYGGARFLLSVIVLLPVLYFLNKTNKKQIQNNDIAKEEHSPEELEKQKKTLIIAGIICGTVLFIATTLQQFGLVFTTAGKTGFITALYIILVPIFSIFLKHRPGLNCWLGVGLGAIGLYLLCITEAFTIALGDFVVLIGAAFWSAHILVIDHFLPKISDPVKLALIQFIVVTVYSWIGAFLFEDVTLASIIQCAIPILYAGILSGGVGFTLQILGQRYTNPTVASLLLSMEAVFGAVFGYLLLNEIMTIKEKKSVIQL